MSSRIPLWACATIGVGIIAIAAIIEYAMGRVPICTCGQIRLWVGTVNSPENSQQITDWYSFSHVIHGFLLYGFARLISRRKWPLATCLLVAIFLEASWEVLENSSFIINRYRTITTSWGYTGDSILNSVCDILCCIAGFFLAAYLPVWLTLTLALLMEVGVGYAIRDNLTLNIIMLIHPFDFIKHWQMGKG